MKNATFSVNTLVRFCKPAVLALFFAGLLNTTPAQATDKPKAAPVEVKYLGSNNGKPLFQIQFSNPQADEVSITLRDEYGYTLYTDVSKEKAYSRKLQFDDLGTDRLKLTVLLRTKKDVQTQTFEITKNIRTIEDVAVVSL
jgi:hypothetical protein